METAGNTVREIDPAPAPMSFLSVLRSPVKVGFVGCLRCVASFRPVPGGGGSQSVKRWSARSAARMNDLDVEEDTPHNRSKG